MKYSNNITNLLGKSSNEEFPKFRTIKWVEIFDQPNGSYNKDENIRFKAPQVRNDLCDFNEAYIVVTGKITAINSDLPNYGNVPADANYSRKVALKNCAPFFNCILGGDGNTKAAFKNHHPFTRSEIHLNDEHVETCYKFFLIMNMYNLIESSDNYSDSTASLYHFKR